MMLPHPVGFLRCSQWIQNSRLGVKVTLHSPLDGLLSIQCPLWVWGKEIMGFLVVALELQG